MSSVFKPAPLSPRMRAIIAVALGVAIIALPFGMARQLVRHDYFGLGMSALQLLALAGWRWSLILGDRSRLTLGPEGVEHINGRGRVVRTIRWSDIDHIEYARTMIFGRPQGNFTHLRAVLHDQSSSPLAPLGSDGKIALVPVGNDGNALSFEVLLAQLWRQPIITPPHTKKC